MSNIVTVSSGRATTTGHIDISSAGAAVGDILYFMPNADGGGGTTSITAVGFTNDGNTSVNWTIEGPPAGVTTSWMLELKLGAGFATAYTVTVNPASTSGIECLWFIARNNVTAGLLSTDFVSFGNSGSGGTVNLTNPGGTTSMANEQLYWLSVGQNPDTDQGPATWSNVLFQFTSIWGFGVDCISSVAQAVAGPTGTITAPSSQTINNWNSIVVAIKPAISSNPSNAIFYSSDF